MKFSTLLFSLSVLLIVASCKKQESSDQNQNEDNELLTSVYLNFIDTISQDTLRYGWRQPAGPGSAISIDTINLVAGKYYKAFTEVWDESKTPAIQFNDEITELANEHRFFYTCTNTEIQIQITDSDTQVPPMPLGLYFNWKPNTSNSWQGNLQVKLKHYTSSSPKTGGENAGSTDIEVQFPVRVK